MFLDANVFIYAYEFGDKKSRNSQALLRRIITGEVRAHTSILVLNEVLHFFLTNQGLERGRHIFLQIRKMPNLIILPVDDRCLDHVIRFIDYNLDTTDAYHAATMVANGLDVICSYDQGFDKAKGILRQEPK